MKRPSLKHRLAHTRVPKNATGDTPIYDALARWFDPAAPRPDLERKPIVLEQLPETMRRPVEFDMEPEDPERLRIVKFVPVDESEDEW